MQQNPELSTKKLVEIDEMLKTRVVTYNMYSKGIDDSTYLTAVPPVPAKSAAYDKEKATRWVASHTNPQFRHYAEAMIANLQYVSFATFYAELINCVQQVNALYKEKGICDDELLIIVPNLSQNKSNTWVLSLALAHLDIKPKYILPNHPTSLLINYFKLNPGIKRLLTFDDAGYSGIDLSFFLSTVRHNARVTNPEVEFDIVVPYLTRIAKQKLSEVGNVIYSQTIPSLRDVLLIDPNDERELQEILCSNYERELAELSLTYFDHKMADSYSVPENCLREGRKIDHESGNEAIPFIPEITPPYKVYNAARTRHLVETVLTEEDCEELLAENDHRFVK
ncbi:MAG: hypothetical protein M3R00_05290 [Pseudomonadota bacterium]|nr:hypothetical protein [Pseudomonadota bacterium]